MAQAVPSLTFSPGSFSSMRLVSDGLHLTTQRRGVTPFVLFWKRSGYIS
jgi:hypothetical protein